MNALFGYQFLLSILILSFTTFAQFMNFETTGTVENTMNIAEQRQQYYPFIPYWIAADEAKINSIVNHIEKRVTVREPLHSAIHINDTRKRMAFGKTNNKASLARHYGTSANIDTSNDYDRQTAFRLLALNGARGFGK